MNKPFRISERKRFIPALIKTDAWDTQSSQRKDSSKLTFSIGLYMYFFFSDRRLQIIRQKTFQKFTELILIFYHEEKCMTSVAWEPGKFYSSFYVWNAPF